MSHTKWMLLGIFLKGRDGAFLLRLCLFCIAYSSYHINLYILISSPRLHPPAVPDIELIPAIFVDAVAIAIVGFSMAVSMAKIFALKHGYTIDGNQVKVAELIC